MASISVSPDSAVLTEGASLQIAAELKDSLGEVLTGRAVTWTSSATEIVTVTAEGVAAGVIAGTARIAATSEGRSDTAIIVVVRASVASVEITPAPVRLWVGRRLEMTATVRDAAGNPLTGRLLKWTSSNSSVATVSTTGVVSGKGPGVADIEVAVEGKAATAAVTAIWNTSGHWNGWANGCTWLPQFNDCYESGSFSIELSEVESNGMISGTAIRTAGASQSGLTVGGENTPLWLRLTFTDAEGIAFKFEGVWDRNGTLRLCGLLYMPALGASFPICIART